MEAKSIEENMVKYSFVCAGCEAEGTLGVPEDQHKPFSCPEGCGATYIQWKLNGVYRLKCVVCPVFEK